MLVRCDLNVPLDGSTITDDTRIRASIPTVKYLMEKGAKARSCTAQLELGVSLRGGRGVARRVCQPRAVGELVGAIRGARFVSWCRREGFVNRGGRWGVVCKGVRLDMVLRTHDLFHRSRLGVLQTISSSPPGHALQLKSSA